MDVGLWQEAANAVPRLRRLARRGDDKAPDNAVRLRGRSILVSRLEIRLNTDEGLVFLLVARVDALRQPCEQMNRLGMLSGLPLRVANG